MSFDLDRFIAAQDADGTYGRVLQELGRGAKTSHWMWFVFPQIAGLGYSAMSQHYAIASLDEAQAFVAHPVLGPRLRECAALVVGAPGTAEDIFGGIDAQKLHSSMTLFHRADPAESLFQHVLDAYFDGDPDPATDKLL